MTRNAAFPEDALARLPHRFGWLVLAAGVPLIASRVPNIILTFAQLLGTGILVVVCYWAPGYLVMRKTRLLAGDITDHFLAATIGVAAASAVHYLAVRTLGGMPACHLAPAAAGVIALTALVGGRGRHPAAYDWSDLGLAALVLSGATAYLAVIYFPLLGAHENGYELRRYEPFLGYDYIFHTAPISEWGRSVTQHFPWMGHRTHGYYHFMDVSAGAMFHRLLGIQPLIVELKLLPLLFMWLASGAAFSLLVRLGVGRFTSALGANVVVFSDPTAVSAGLSIPNVWLGIALFLAALSFLSLPGEERPYARCAASGAICGAAIQCRPEIVILMSLLAAVWWLTAAGNRRRPFAFGIGLVAGASVFFLLAVSISKFCGATPIRIAPGAFFASVAEEISGPMPAPFKAALGFLATAALHLHVSLAVAVLRFKPLVGMLKKRLPMRVLAGCVAGVAALTTFLYLPLPASVGHHWWIFGGGVAGAVVTVVLLDQWFASKKWLWLVLVLYMTAVIAAARNAINADPAGARTFTREELRLAQYVRDHTQPTALFTMHPAEWGGFPWALIERRWLTAVPDMERLPTAPLAFCESDALLAEADSLMRWQARIFEPGWSVEVRRLYDLGARYLILGPLTRSPPAELREHLRPLLVTGRYDLYAIKPRPGAPSVLGP